MKKAVSLIIIIISLFLVFLQHLVSFDLFHDSMWYQFLIIIILFIIQAFSIIILFKHGGPKSGIVLFVVFFVSIIYDLWLVLSSIDPQTVYGFDFLSTLSLLGDLACIYLLLVQKKKRKGRR